MPARRTKTSPTRNARRVPFRRQTEGSSRQMAVNTNSYYQVFNPPRALPITVHRYSANTFSIVASAGADVTGALYFTLDSVAGSSDFTSLYDQYRIAGVEVELFWGTDALTPGQIYLAPDYDDATTVSVANLLQYSACKRFPIGKNIFLRMDRLACDLSVYGTSGSAPGRVVYNPWLDCGKPDVQHFGLKYGIPAGPNFTATVMVRYKLQFRQVR